MQPSRKTGREALKNAAVPSGALNVPSLVPLAEPSVQSRRDQVAKEAVVVERALVATGGSGEPLSARHHVLEQADLCK